MYCVYKLNDHGDDVKINIKRRGMSSEVKDIINELIYEKDISMPKRIMIQLSKKKHNEGENAIDKVFEIKRKRKEKTPPN